MSAQEETDPALIKPVDDEPGAGASTALQNHPIAIAWRQLSYVWSCALLVFALTMVIYGIIKEWNNPPWDHWHPAFDLCLFFLMMTWIALLEGAQISIVGLQNVNVEQYKDTYPRAYDVCKLAHKGPNVERFLVGRQFLLLFNGFLVSRVGGAADRGENFYIGDWEWNDEATQFFWMNSALLMIVIIVPGQLVSQLIAADKMLGFLDLRFYGLYTVLYPCLFVESIGLVHSSYMLKDVLCKISGIDLKSADPAKQMKKDFLYYARVLLSISAVIFSGTFIIKGLAMNQTGVNTGAGWRKLPGGAAVVVGLLFLFIMACAEGLQVSALALAEVPTSTWRKKSPLAYRTIQLCFAGRNMQAFLVGRQFMVAMMMVLLAKVTSYAGSEGVIDGDDWGMGKDFNEGLLQTGFLGAILVVNVAQLASQITASIFPISFINNHILNWLLRLMLLIEFSGVVNACWPLSRFVDSALGLKPDPFQDDESVKTPAHDILERKKSMGIPVSKGSSPFDLHQPEQEYHVEYTYRVSYV